MRTHPLRLAPALACAALLAALGGCAKAPSLRSVLAERYPGYDQVLPQSAVAMSEPAFDYLPGNVGAFDSQQARTRLEAASWVSKNIYCPTNVPLSMYRARERAPTRVVHDLGFSLRRALELKKAQANLQLEENEVEHLRQVTIEIAAPRSYSLQRALALHTDPACLAALAGRTDLKRIRGVLVGNVRVSVLFKDNVSAFVKLAVYNKLQNTIGAGFVRGESYELSADNVVFGARLSDDVRLPTQSVATR